MNLLFLCINLGDLSKHVGTVLSPCNLLWIHHRDLSEKRINIGLSLSQVEIHKFVTICEF